MLKKVLQKIFKKKKIEEDKSIFEFPGWEKLDYPEYLKACCKIGAGYFSEKGNMRR